jgi:hypothetical protein
MPFPPGQPPTLAGRIESGVDPDSVAEVWPKPADAVVMATIVVRIDTING